MGTDNTTGKRQGTPSHKDRANALLGLALTAQAPDAACPPLADITLWHAGELDEAAAAHVRHHVAHCERCYGTWLDFAEIQLPEAAVAAAATSSPWRRLTDRIAAAAGRPWLAGGGVALVAAVLVMTLLPFGATGLSRYDLVVSGQVSEVRGTTDAASPQVRNVFETGSRLDLLLRPADPMDEMPTVRVYLASAAGDRAYVSLDELRVNTSDKGAVRLQAVLGSDIVAPAGDYDLLLALGRAQRLPSADALDRALSNRAHVQEDNWLGWRVSVRFVDRQPRP